MTVQQNAWRHFPWKPLLVKTSVAPEYIWSTELWRQKNLTGQTPTHLCFTFMEKKTPLMAKTQHTNEWMFQVTCHRCLTHVCWSFAERCVSPVAGGGGPLRRTSRWSRYQLGWSGSGCCSGQTACWVGWTWPDRAESPETCMWMVQTDVGGSHNRVSVKMEKWWLLKHDPESISSVIFLDRASVCRVCFQSAGSTHFISRSDFSFKCYIIIIITRENIKEVCNVRKFFMSGSGYRPVCFGSDTFTSGFRQSTMVESGLIVFGLVQS